MKHALFMTKEEALAHVPTVQAAVDAANLPGPKVLIQTPIFIEWLNRWAVAIPVECEEQGEIVEAVERPVEREE